MISGGRLSSGKSGGRRDRCRLSSYSVSYFFAWFARFRPPFSLGTYNRGRFLLRI